MPKSAKILFVCMVDCRIGNTDMCMRGGNTWVLSCPAVIGSLETEFEQQVEMGLWPKLRRSRWALTYLHAGTSCKGVAALHQPEPVNISWENKLKSDDNRSGPGFTPCCVMGEARRGARLVMFHGTPLL